jgi:hypothetical protein
MASSYPDMPIFRPRDLLTFFAAGFAIQRLLNTDVTNPELLRSANWS